MELPSLHGPLGCVPVATTFRVQDVGSRGLGF